MKSKRARIIVGVLGLVVLLISWYGYKEYNREHIFLHDSKAEISITPENLFLAFEEDENSANERFLDKIVELQGWVSNVSLEHDAHIINFDVGAIMGGVSCELDSRLEHDLPKEGDLITIRGKCTGYLMDVHLVQSVLIK